MYEWLIVGFIVGYWCKSERIKNKKLSDAIRGGCKNV